MALPQKIKVNDITGASSPDLIDNDLNAGIKQPVIDILGIPNDTNISAAGLNFVAAGLDRVIFQDAAVDPASAGRLQRNAANLLFHDGTAARALVGAATTQTLTNKTVNLSSNTLTGTTAQFNTALSDNDFATLAGSESLSNKTISAPVFSGTATGTYTLGGTPTVSSLINLTSGQITFPVAQAASADANTLDDYEEGSWTPSVGGTATYTQQQGKYTKVGRQVTLTCNLIINSLGTGSTNTISGNPFTLPADTIGGIGAVYWSSAGSSLVTCIAKVSSGSSSIELFSATAAATGLSLGTVFANSTNVQFSLTFMVAT